MVVCRQDFDGKYLLGDLKERSLEEILESQELKDILCNSVSKDVLYQNKVFADEFVE